MIEHCEGGSFRKEFITSRDVRPTSLQDRYFLLRYFLRGEKKPSGREGETLMIAEPRDPRPSLPRFYSSGRGCQLSSPNRERRCQAFYMCHHASSCSEVSRLATKIQELSLARNKLVSLPPFPRARALTHLCQQQSPSWRWATRT